MVQLTNMRETMGRHCTPLAVAVLLVLSACVGTTSALPPGSMMQPPTSSPPPILEGQQPAMVVDSPTAPVSEDGQSWAGPSAPVMDGVQVVANRDSAIVLLPAVTGVVDYRVFRLPAGAAVSSVNGAEQVNGTVIHCAGYRQHNDKYTGTRELLRLVEVTNLSGPTTLVVEAIDTACPFTGHLAPSHHDIRVTIDEVPAVDRVIFSLFTAAEIQARYGSLILNGHGPGATLGGQGPTTPPKVLARTTIRVTPSGTAQPRTRDFFDDFDGRSGPITFANKVPDADRAYTPGRHFSNAKWDFYSFNDHDELAAITEERGLLHVTLPDWEQDVFASVVAVPRRVAKLSSTTYLHLTYEVATNSTSRRYWWVGLCGAGEPGKTFDASNHFAGRLINTPFFYQPDGYNVSVEGWNCLQFFPRDGAPFPLPPTNTRSQSDLRVMVNTAGAPARQSVVNLSPAQYPESAAAPSWFRQQDAAGNLGAPMLDDQLLISPRTRFDAYVRRDRVVLFVNGEQRLCNDFPNHALTMAEAGVAFGQVLYHSAAERLEFTRSYDDRGAQRYYLENAPYADERDWDNLGYEEDLAAPSSFDASRCFKAP
jgi:hypothetical protein